MMGKTAIFYCLLVASGLIAPVAGPPVQEDEGFWCFVSIEKFLKLCLHLGGRVWNSFHFDEIFPSRFLSDSEVLSQQVLA